MDQPKSFETISVGDESTVVAEYVIDPSAETAYQSEAELESELIRILQSQAYEFVPIHTEAQLVENLRRQLELLNDITFSDAEWQRFFRESVSSASDNIVDKTVRIQEDHVQVLTRDDGTSKNIKLLDKTHIHRNRLQVINQYEVGQADGARYDNRYDVTILVNGLPLVHVELKRRGVILREAFNQIRRYHRDSFWAGSGLFDYVQLFVISNGTLTKYYSNTTRDQHVKDASSATSKRKSFQSFEFTSWWADANNSPIQDLPSFARAFFTKHTLLAILTRYCVLTVDKQLLVMRPYQIVATERILQKINIATNYKKLGTVDAGGYIWHTTGSGKTLTSFKTAQLATQLPGVEKVLFVVDRKDLDYQTMKEYNRFQEGAANSNNSTAVLRSQLSDPSTKIIITTIQKLATFIKSTKGHAIFDGHIVIIFDECHRSQFGEMHTAIARAFKRYHMFGFTGTPIFAANSSSCGNPRAKTTEQAFGEKLHTYTIVNAIGDKNVLPFRVSYVNTIAVGPVVDKTVSAIETEETLLNPRRVNLIVHYVCENFATKTHRNAAYQLDKNKVRGFNALFATASIQAARTYYKTFALAQHDLPEAQRLKIAMIYSFAPNEDPDNFDDEGFDAESLPADSRQALEDAISDYNRMFGTSWDTSSKGFESYYKDVSERLKNRELDMAIVVNMFLTGFDATSINTLFVDKNLKSHGLVQAFSRTNRILNSVKTHGNIVCFRNLEEATNDALTLFGNKDSHGIVLMKPFDDYYSEYSAKVDELLQRFPLGQPITSEQEQKEFIALYGAILRLANILTAFDEFAGKEILSPRQSQDYRSVYLDLYADFRHDKDAEREPIADDVVFEIELVKQVEINIDFILMLVDKFRRETGGDGADKEIRAEISRSIDASPSLRNKKDLIEAFVDRVSHTGRIDDEWAAYIAGQRATELDDIIKTENLREEQARQFVDMAFRDGAVRTSGTEITKILPPTSRFAKVDGHAERKRRVLDKLTTFFDRFMGLGGGI